MKDITDPNDGDRRSTAEEIEKALRDNYSECGLTEKGRQDMRDDWVWRTDEDGKAHQCGEKPRGLNFMIDEYDVDKSKELT